MLEQLTLPTACALALVLLGVVLPWLRGTPRPLFPPGPKGVPFIGNVFDVPKGHGWAVYREWAQKFS